MPKFVLYDYSDTDYADIALLPQHEITADRVEFKGEFAVFYDMGKLLAAFPARGFQYLKQETF